MGKIVDLARKRFWNTEIFELIESEIEQLKGQVKLNLTNMETLNKRLKALEDIHQGRLTAEILEKAHVPTDKDDKPEGGLKKGDLIWSSWWECHGIFDYANQLSIYGWWAPNKSHGYKGGYDWFWRENVSFVSRPRFPDRKER